MTSACRRSGSASANEACSSAFAFASATPAGLRPHTPISQTASTPAGTAASQSGAATQSSCRPRPPARCRCLDGAAAAGAQCLGADAAEQQRKQSRGPGPAGLVTGADAGSVVAVEVLIEQHQVAPVRVGLQDRLPTMHGTAAVRVL